MLSSRMSLGSSKIKLLSWSCGRFALENLRISHGTNIPLKNFGMSCHPVGLRVPPTCSLASAPDINKLNCRGKSKWTSKNSEDEDSDEADEEEIVLENGIGYADRRFKVPSLRLDVCIKAAFKLSRSSAEKEIYASKFRINGEKVTKCSQTLMVDDVIEYLKTNSSKVNSSLAEVAKAEVRHIGGFKDAGTHYYVVFRIYSNQFVSQWDS